MLDGLEDTGAGGSGTAYNVDADIAARYHSRYDFLRCHAGVAVVAVAQDFDTGDAAVVDLDLNLGTDGPVPFVFR